MRIVAGERKGHRILAPRGADTRPTSDRVREAAFNLIGPVDGATVLDLYAGSGAMGLEALSRGAARAVFVESRAEAARTIERNLDHLRLTGAEVVRRDALGALAAERQRDARTTSSSSTRPTRSGSRWGRASRVYLPSVLAPDGVLVVETAARVEPDLPLRLRTSRRYGSARLTLFDQP